MNYLTNVSNNKLINLLENSNSISEIVRYFNTTCTGASYRILRNETKLRGFEDKYLSLAIKGRKNAGKNNATRNKKISDVTSPDYLCVDSTLNRGSVKRYIIRNNIIPYICSDCGNTGQWNEKNLTLQLEHKNGINNDNRIENLSFLCPNCHTQTTTYGGRNIKARIV